MVGYFAVERAGKEETDSSGREKLKGQSNTVPMSLAKHGPWWRRKLLGLDLPMTIPLLRTILEDLHYCGTNIMFGIQPR